MLILACQVPLGAQATMPCGCVVITGQRYDLPASGASRATRTWAVETPCAAHPERRRALLEIGASERLHYDGGDPLRGLGNNTPSHAATKH
jgi:hypothetical protein